jgi:hypothetical protein
LVGIAGLSLVIRLLRGAPTGQIRRRRYLCQMNQVT